MPRDTFAYSEAMKDFSRALPLVGASNFRDLGGYAGHDGRTVRWRRLFRSDHLAALTTQDQQVLSGLGVTRAFDFRGVLESAAQRYALPEVQYHALPIEPTVVQRAKELAAAGEPLTASITVGLMQETYRAFVTHNTAQFGALFAHLLQDNAPLVFHCTAGKDRTGFAAALILSALGVSKDVILQDYLLTNALYKRPASVSGTTPDEVLQVLWRVQADFLDAAMQVVDQDYGGVHNYLARHLSVGDAEQRHLAQLYLQ